MPAFHEALGFIGIECSRLTIEKEGMPLILPFDNTLFLK